MRLLRRVESLERVVGALLRRRERHTCPRRAENPWSHDENRDTYAPRHGLVSQPRGCTYCGSLPPDDFMEAVRRGAEVGPTDKSYKLYVTLSTVGSTRDAKFYTPHLSPAQSREFYDLWRAGQVRWGYPGGPYRSLYLPGLEEWR